MTEYHLYRCSKCKWIYLREDDRKWFESRCGDKKSMLIRFSKNPLTCQNCPANQKHSVKGYSFCIETWGKEGLSWAENINIDSEENRPTWCPLEGSLAKGVHWPNKEKEI